MTEESGNNGAVDATKTATTTTDTAASQAAATTTTDTTTVTPDWSADWRLKMAGGDEKRAKAYEKYASPKDVADAHLSLQQQLSTGEYRKKLPDNPKPEELTAWRKANGIPESADKYDLNLPDGLVLGENDLPVAQAFAAEMHGVNADQKTVQKALTWWAKSQQAGLAARQTEDSEYKRQTEDALRAEWGGEYRMNEASIANFTAGLPGELSKTIMGARAPDGRLLWDNPSFRSHMLKQAYLENPARLVVPANGGDSLDAIEQQLAEIKKVSQEDPRRYNKDTAMQQRRGKLLEAQSMLQNRKAS